MKRERYSQAFRKILDADSDGEIPRGSERGQVAGADGSKGDPDGEAFWDIVHGNGQDQEDGAAPSLGPGRVVVLLEH